MPNILGSDSSGNVLQATIYFNYSKQIDRATYTDLVVERDLIGTKRTAIDRIGFGSSEFTRDVWCSPQAMENLIAMRGQVVTFEGTDYDITFTSLVSDVIDTYNNARISKVSIRFKEIATT